ncbi:MAG: hypothetical protein AAGA71_05390 [Pseudomonadota bacterium]
MAGILQTAVSTLIAALVMGALGWVAMRAGSRSVDHATRRIVPNPTVICAIAAGCFALGGVAIYAALFHNGGIAAWCVGLPSVSFGILMLLGLSPRMAVTWDPVRLEGPASYGMPPFGPKRASMTYDAIVEVGIDRMGSFYVLDAQGQKIRWSEYYSGFHELVDHISARRPDLVEEPDH